jgi:L-fuconolactonase
MTKIDAHLHFWNLERLNYHWLLPQNKTLHRNFEPPELLAGLSETGVEGAVVVQAAHSEAEIAYLFSLAKDYPFIRGVVGWLDLTALDLRERIAKYKAQGKLCGVRYPLPLAEPRADTLQALKVIAEADLAFDLLVRPSELVFLPQLIEITPTMRWVINHCAQPDLKSGEMKEWQANLTKVASYPNVYCKISGLITQFGRSDWATTDFQPYFEKVLELFGAEHLMWGSDYPVCLQAGSYYRVYQLMTELMITLSETEQFQIWGETANQVYKLNS